jgi:hypothetical protein
VAHRQWVSARSGLTNQPHHPERSDGSSISGAKHQVPRFRFAPFGVEQRSAQKSRGYQKENADPISLACCLPALRSMPCGTFDALLRFCPKAHQLRRFVLQFRAMLRWRNADKLCAWLEAASASHFRFLAQFANTLRRDLKAVELSINDPMEQRPH